MAGTIDSPMTMTGRFGCVKMTTFTPALAR